MGQSQGSMSPNRVFEQKENKYARDEPPTHDNNGKRGRSTIVALDEDHKRPKTIRDNPATRYAPDKYARDEPPTHDNNGKRGRSTLVALDEDQKRPKTIRDNPATRYAPDKFVLSDSEDSIDENSINIDNQNDHIQEPEAEPAPDLDRPEPDLDRPEPDLDRPEPDLDRPEPIEEKPQQLLKLKFKATDWDKAPEDFEVQRLLESDDKHMFVYWKDWEPNTGQLVAIDELETTCADLLQEARLRTEVMDIIEQEFRGVKRYENFVRRRFLEKPKRSAYNFRLADTEFYYNEVNRIDKRAPVFIESWTRFRYTREFEYTNKLIYHESELPKIEASVLRIDNPIKEDINDCPCCKNCICRQCYLPESSVEMTRLYYSPEGLLEISESDKDRTPLWVVECTESCGNEPNCPWRKVSKGRQIPLLLFDEGDKGWGVRAMTDIPRGSFIEEYTGMVYDNEAFTNMKINSTKSLGFNAENSILDAFNAGNITRFINHSCDNNACFVNVHCEDRLYKMRCAVFAIRDIKKGEEITISYWPKNFLEAHFAANGATVECLCHSKKCMKKLPK